MLKKDKEKVFGGDWTPEHLDYFLSLKDPEGISDDFHVVQEAYRHMPLDGFELFINRFKQAGRDLNAKGSNGQTIKEVIGEHPASKGYSSLL